jgi:hypothetical protein
LLLGVLAAGFENR